MLQSCKQLSLSLSLSVCVCVCVCVCVTKLNTSYYDKKRQQLLVETFLVCSKVWPIPSFSSIYSWLLKDLSYILSSLIIFLLSVKTQKFKKCTFFPVALYIMATVVTYGLLYYPVFACLSTQWIFIGNLLGAAFSVCL